MCICQTRKEANGLICQINELRTYGEEYDGGFWSHYELVIINIELGSVVDRQEGYLEECEEWMEEAIAEMAA